MGASVVVAVCATVIAVVSLAVSVYEARASRRHNRISVRPFLELRVGLSQGRPAGLQLINAGLGPAVITRTVLTLDGQLLGEFSEASVNVLRSKLSVRPPICWDLAGQPTLLDLLMPAVPGCAAQIGMIGAAAVPAGPLLWCPAAAPAR